MITWYRTGKWNTEVDPVEVEKETDKFVTIKGRRNAKMGYYWFHRSEIDALRHLFVNEQRKYKNAMRDVESASKNLSYLSIRINTLTETT